jgi:outer membrane assembly lipoprotein YfiO
LGRRSTNSKQFITAASEFTRFLGAYPIHSRAHEAALGVYKSNEALSPHYQRDQTFTEQALRICQNVANDYLGTEMGTEAGEIAIAMRGKLAEKLFESRMYYFRRGAYDSSVINFADVVEAYPGTEWAPRALAAIMDAYTEIGYADEVESARNRLLRLDPDSPEARVILAAQENAGRWPRQCLHGLAVQCDST